MDRTFTIKSERTELFNAFYAGWVRGNQEHDTEVHQGMVESDWESYLLEKSREEPGGD